MYIYNYLGNMIIYDYMLYIIYDHRVNAWPYEEEGRKGEKNKSISSRIGMNFLCFSDSEVKPKKNL